MLKTDTKIKTASSIIRKYQDNTIILFQNTSPEITKDTKNLAKFLAENFLVNSSKKIRQNSKKKSNQL